MMFRAVLCVLALGITSAFQAPRNAWTRTTPMMSDALYAPTVRLLSHPIRH